MSEINLAQITELAAKSGRFQVEKNGHDQSITITRRNPTSGKIIEGVRCFITGQCLDLVWNLSPPLSLSEAAKHLNLV